MTTIKSHTDLEQSKKLAEILPTETADMWWAWYSSPFDTGHYDYFPMFHKPVCNSNESIPCWSLAALLSVLPFHLFINNQRYAFNMHKGLNKNGETYTIRYNIYNTDICIYSTEYYNNPVDACVEMILKLHEQNLIIKSYTNSKTKQSYKILSSSEKLESVLFRNEEDYLSYIKDKNYIDEEDYKTIKFSKPKSYPAILITYFLISNNRLINHKVFGEYIYPHNFK